nr:immunoglobulin light chain junction region [Macaca mulatta]MOY16119.1 immunoglobulin light chain junction region [Macaca mulatta]MOY17172.1 immunoglobulin light chain junction region [Macaca mulatta]
DYYCCSYTTRSDVLF